MTVDRDPRTMDDVDDVLEKILDHLDHENPGGVRGVYLYGSAVSGGFRPDSDVDVLLLTEQSLSGDERASLTDLLMRVSGWKGHAETIPDAADGRPLELTSIVVDDRGQWPDPPAHDFQFGEWLRAEILAGRELRPTTDPDVPILIATAHHAHRVLRGPSLADVVARVPAGILRDSMLATIPDILDEIVGDERNTLLALARMITTLRTGNIVPKDAAAAGIGELLSSDDRSLLERARRAYVGEAEDDWAGLEDAVTALAHRLAAEAWSAQAPETS